MEHATIFMCLAAMGAFFMAFNNGANDVANSFASAVGSKAITVKQAFLIASFMNFLGALLLGGHVAARLIEEVIHPEMFASPVDYVIAMVSVMVAAGSFVLFSSLTGMPVSSSHAIVASLTGVSIAVAGWASVNWLLIGVIVLSWVISPLLAGSLAWLMESGIKRFVVGSGGSGIKKRVQQWVPILFAFTVAAALYALFKGTRLPHVMEAHLFEVLLLAFLGGFVVYFASQSVIEQWMRDEPDTVSSSEGVFRRLQVGTSAYVAFAHGSNDVANSITPVFAIYLVASRGGIPENLEKGLAFRSGSWC
jgi:PiT family inorganic phosphate transporter